MSGGQFLPHSGGPPGDQFPSFPFSSLVPVRHWARDPALRSWPVLLLIALVCVPPLALVVLNNGGESALHDVAWVFAFYFAVAWLPEQALAPSALPIHGQTAPLPWSPGPAGPVYPAGPDEHGPGVQGHAAGSGVPAATPPGSPPVPPSPVPSHGVPAGQSAPYGAWWQSHPGPVRPAHQGAAPSGPAYSTAEQPTVVVPQPGAAQRKASPKPWWEQ